MDLIPRKEVLDLFRISVWTLRRWEQKRGFPKPIHVSPAIRMYDKAAIDEWLKTRPTNL